MCLDCDRHTSAIGDGADAVWDAELDDDEREDEQEDEREDEREDEQERELNEVYAFWVWAQAVHERVHAAAVAAARELARLKEPANGPLASGAGEAGTKQEEE